MKTAAEQLLGKELDGGWKVIEKVNRPTASTGGHFSVGYIVENASEQKGFLKALDYASALANYQDPAQKLYELTSAFLFERNLLYKCKDNRLRRVVIAIMDGTIKVDPSPTGTVQYIIFELADCDVRSYMKFNKNFDLAWTLRSLHHVATGIFELHGRGIAHQDVKASNVLVFRGRESKVTDLGRAATRDVKSPYEAKIVPGDWSYAPPELLYGGVPLDWNRRRFGCDLYLLGSMVVFFFTGASMTSLILSKLEDFQHYLVWRGMFGDILPHLKRAFGLALEEFRQEVDEGFRNDLTTMVRQLCEPDPDLRGHPLNLAALGGNKQSLERYISAFNLLASRAELGMKGGVI